MKQCILVLFLVSFTFPVFGEGDPIEGKAIYAICAECHGQTGEGLHAANAPRLAGLRDWYLIGQLQKFRSGLRGSDPGNVFGSKMAEVAVTLSNEKALLDVAAYIGTFEAIRTTRTELTGDPARGQDLSRYCLRCHGERGQGYKAPKVITYKSHYGPRISGQHDWYLIRQIRNYRDGIRGSNEDKATRLHLLEVKSLQNDQDIFDLVAYIGTLK